MPRLFSATEPDFTMRRGMKLLKNTCRHRTYYYCGKIHQGKISGCGNTRGGADFAVRTAGERLFKKGF
jgi:hypothetical protein